MTEERLIIPRKTTNKFFLTIAIGVILLIAGIIMMVAGGGAEHGGGHGEAAGAGHEAASWTKRLFLNLWLNNVYFTGIALIGVFFVAIQYVAYAGWSVLIKRIPEALGYYLPIG